MHCDRIDADIGISGYKFLLTKVNMSLNKRVVVVAASMEGIDALARLVGQLPSTFPIPIVVHVNRLQEHVINKLKSPTWRSASKLDLVHAQSGNMLVAGRVYIVPASESMCFTATGTLAQAPDASLSSADALFESASHWYQAGTIGLVLSGLGTDGTRGLRAIAKVDGTRIIQSPIETTFSSMPSNALVDGHVQHSVLLDQIGHLLLSLIDHEVPAYGVVPGKLRRSSRRVLTSGEQQKESLERSIVGILNMMREQLLMDIVFVTKRSGDRVVVCHSTQSGGDAGNEGISVPKDQSLCQRVLDGHLPAIMSDVESMRLTHDVPETPVHVGAYMSAPVWLNNGDFYGSLCCLSAHSAPELNHVQSRRLQMSARQIARLINESEAAV